MHTPDVQPISPIVRPFARRLLQLLFVGLLAMGLTACSGNLPNRNLVEKAIALQFSQTQTELARQLSVPSLSQPSFRIDDIKVKSRQPLKIDGLQSYRVRGTYTLTLTYPDRKVVQHRNPFEVYLQRQSEGKTWRLARLESARTGASEPPPRWLTQLLQ